MGVEFGKVVGPFATQHVIVGGKVVGKIRKVRNGLYSLTAWDRTTFKTQALESSPAIQFDSRNKCKAQAKASWGKL